MASFRRPSSPILTDQELSPDSDGPAAVDGSDDLLASIMEAPPSAGSAGLMELRLRWRKLSPEKRIVLVALARQMADEGGDR